MLKINVNFKGRCVFPAFLGISDGWGVGMRGSDAFVGDCSAGQNWREWRSMSTSSAPSCDALERFLFSTLAAISLSLGVAGAPANTRASIAPCAEKSADGYAHRKPKDLHKLKDRGQF
jgi:hypothetical protein